MSQSTKLASSGSMSLSFEYDFPNVVILTTKVHLSQEPINNKFALNLRVYVQIYTLTQAFDKKFRNHFL